MIYFFCPTCHEAYAVPDDRAGHKATCTRCGERLKVPGGSEPEVPEVPVVPAPRRQPVLRTVGFVLIVCSSVVLVVGLGWWWPETARPLTQEEMIRLHYEVMEKKDREV